MSTVDNELAKSEQTLEVNLATARLVLERLRSYDHNDIHLNKPVHIQSLAIAARFVEPSEFQKLTQEEDPLKLALIVRQMALRQQMEDLETFCSSPPNPKLQENIIDKMRSSADAIKTLLAQPEINPHMLENITGPIYCDSKVLEENGVNPMQVNLLARANTSLNASLITDGTMPKIQSASPPPAGSAASG